MSHTAPAAPTAARANPAPPFTVVATAERLAELYRPPGALVARKKLDRLDEQSRAFVALSPFVLLGTLGSDGGVDVSPRGGHPGFTHVIDEPRPDGSTVSYVVIPDLNGNNLIDSIKGVVANGRAALLVTVPGKDETLRINGAAWITDDPAVLNSFSAEVRTPKSAVVVRADEVYVHCAKAFRRGRVWDPGSWAELAAAPGIEHIVCAQGLVVGVELDAIRADLDEGYELDLAADRPE